VSKVEIKPPSDKARDWTKAGASVLGEAQDKVMSAKSSLETATFSRLFEYIHVEKQFLILIILKKF
jgi:hypothetical protein